MDVEGWIVEFDAKQTRQRVRRLLGKGLQQYGELVHLADDPEPLNGDATVWSLAPNRDSALLSAGLAWDLAYAMQDLPGVLLAEPIVPVPGMADDEDVPAVPRSLGSFGADRDIEESDAHDWAIDKMHVRQAWQTLAQHVGTASPGSGVVVAHPDTGYTEHPELVTGLALDLQRGRNFKDRGQVLPRDPLTGKAAGHGTATASVMTSAADTHVFPGVIGVAPGVTLVPLRVHDSVIHFSWGNLAQALYHAADSGCHIVSMSLGGAWAGNTLRRAVEYAASRGVILISAAGNHTPFVVFPALYPQVIAVAGSNARDALWSGSALGPSVAVTAPGESVWRGKAETGRDGLPEYTVKRSSGTSYATALTAGACALWLHRHDRNALLQRYGAQGLGPVFRDLLQSSVRRVAGWPTKKAGPGIVDVEGLVSSALPATLPAPTSLSSKQTHPSIQAIASMNDATEAQARKWARETLQADDLELDAKLDEVGAELSLRVMRQRLDRSHAATPLPMPLSTTAPSRDHLSQRLRAAAPRL